MDFTVLLRVHLRRAKCIVCGTDTTVSGTGHAYPITQRDPLRRTSVPMCMHCHALESFEYRDITQAEFEAEYPNETYITQEEYERIARGDLKLRATSIRHEKHSNYQRDYYGFDLNDLERQFTRDNERDPEVAWARMYEEATGKLLFSYDRVDNVT